MRTFGFNIIRKNSAFYPRTLFVRFTWFSQHTVIISL